MPSIGDELSARGVNLPSLDALDHVDDLEEIFRRYGYEPTDHENWYAIALDIATWQQRMGAYYQAEQAWQTISKEKGTYSTSPTGARIDIKEFLGEGITEPMSLEMVMDELQEFINAAQASPERAVITALERMPEVKYEPYKAAVREAMVSRGIGAIGPLFSVEFDDTKFSKSINDFEKLVARCFGDRELWSRVTDAIFEEQLILTHMQDLLVSLASKSEEEDSTKPLPLPIVQYRNVASAILNKLPTIEKLVGTFKAIPEMSGLLEVEHRELDSLGSILKSMQYMIRSDLAQVEQAESSSEILAFLDQYANDLKEARQIADSLYRRASTIAAAPAAIHTEEDITGRRIEYGISVTQTADKIRGFYGSLTTSINLVQRAVDEMRNFMPHTPSSREMQMYITERRESRAREAASGSVERLRSDFWDIRIKHSSTAEGMPETTYEVYGFGEAVKSRLKEIGMYSPELWGEFEEAEKKIFASASERAEKAWQGYVSDHFANWAGRP